MAVVARGGFAVTEAGSSAPRACRLLRVARMLLAVMLVCPCGWPAPSALCSDGPRRWALLVGIDQYVRLDPLQCAGNDQTVFGRELAKAGFPADQVVLLCDTATNKRFLPFRENIDRELRLLLSLVGPDDVVLFSYSGHGVHVDGKSYLCPTEADLDRPAETLIPVDSVFQQLRECAAAMKVVVVDACRNDPRLPGARDAGGRERLVDGFSRTLEHPPEGLVLLSSCGIGQQSMEDAGLKHGVFMYHLIQGIHGRAANADGSVTLASLYDYASLETKKYVAKRWGSLQSPALNGELQGAFELARVDPAAVRRGAIAPVPEIDLSGVWRGFFTYDDGRAPVPFAVNLTQNENSFNGASNEPNTFAVAPVATLRATLRGTVDVETRAVHWVKTYDGNGADHSVDYRGTLSRDGTRFEGGRWIVDSQTAGSFTLVRSGT